MSKKLKYQRTNHISYLEVLPALGAERVETLVDAEAVLLPLEDGRLLLPDVTAVEAGRHHEEPFVGDAEDLDVDGRGGSHDVLVPDDVVETFLVPLLCVVKCEVVRPPLARKSIEF